MTISILQNILLSSSDLSLWKYYPNQSASATFLLCPSSKYLLILYPKAYMFLKDSTGFWLGSIKMGLLPIISHKSNLKLPTYIGNKQFCVAWLGLWNESFYCLFYIEQVRILTYDTSCKELLRLLVFFNKYWPLSEDWCRQAWNQCDTSNVSISGDNETLLK